tara:strand:- start:559 stop:1485 length:927 start_codon:yes stop_codon:yes gene_type:complete
MAFIPENNIKVSVSIITYNHENFIVEAIEGVLKQKVNFDYEIIIGDDYSIDGTREILKEYKKRYPKCIKLILHPRRYKEIPGRTNNITNIYACQGKYIALLDGDDYWISENKLQTQVDFLDQHDEYALSSHNAKIFSEENKFKPYLFSEKFIYLNKGSTFTHDDVAKEWFVPTSSLMFRNDLIQQFPDWFWKVYRADYALLLLLSQFGKLKYFDKIQSAWRRNDQSFTSMVKMDSPAGLNLTLTERKIFRENFIAVKEAEDEAYFHFKTSVLMAKKKSYAKMFFYAGKAIMHDFKYLQRFIKALTKRI